MLNLNILCIIIFTFIYSDATFQDPEDDSKTISGGMSVLDIVKHAVKTVIHTLTAQVKNIWIMKRVYDTLFEEGDVIL